MDWKLLDASILKVRMSELDLPPQNILSKSLQNWTAYNDYFL